jgi:hypothetical protein
MMLRPGCDPEAAVLLWEVSLEALAR